MKSIIEKWYVLACKINKYCYLSNLAAYFKIAAIRAFFESVLSYFLFQGFILFTPYFIIDEELGNKSLATLLLLPLFLLFVVCFFYIAWLILGICKVVVETVDSYTDETFSHCEIEKAIMKKMKTTHFTGVICYFCLAFVTSLLYLKNYQTASYMPWYLFVIIATLTGGLLGAIWNSCDWLSDNRIDWKNIIKLANPKSEEDVNQEKRKFSFLVKHMILLTLSSIGIIGLAILCFIVGSSKFEIGANFFNNTYIILFTMICVLYVKTCYIKYFKSEKNEEKIYNNFDEYEGME